MMAATSHCWNIPSPSYKHTVFHFPVIVYQSHKSRDRKTEQRIAEMNCRVSDLAWVITSQEVGWKSVQMRLLEIHVTQ